MTTLTIDRLGSNGDGVANGPKGPVYVPFALPGETVNAAVHGSRGDLVAVLSPSGDRVAPGCCHFGICGGCALQHCAEPVYRAFKRALVADELARHGLEADVAPLMVFPPASRRRLVLTARRSGPAAEVGFRRAQSHDLVAIDECIVAEPALVAALPALRRLAAALATGDKPFRLTVTLTGAGLDVAAEGAGKHDGEARRLAIAAALAERIARLSADGEVLVEARPPALSSGPSMVVPPPGGFVQAVAAAEEAMAALVLGHLAGARRVADLFAGSGAFALRLAAQAGVHAVEGEAAALSALDRAWRATPGLRPVSTERRDLFRRPLLARELDAFSGLVFDPPRAGAEGQARQIARSTIPRVAAVSCNPGTLARDLSILVAGGYRLVAVTPIDQFAFTPHVEAVALLEKAPRRR